MLYKNKKIIVGGLLIGLALVLILPQETLAQFKPRGLILAKYEEVKQNFDQSVSESRNSFQELVKTRKNLKDLSTPEKDDELLEKNKAFLMETSEAMISYLGVLQDKVEEDEKISEDKREIILDDLNEDIHWLSDKKSEVFFAASLLELRKVAPELRERLKKIKLTSRVGNIRVLNVRSALAIKKSENVKEKLSLKLEELAEEGQDVEYLNNQLFLFDEKIIQAKVFHERGREYLAQLEESEDKMSIFPEALESFKSAKDYLSEAKVILDGIILIISNQ